MDKCISCKKRTWEITFINDAGNPEQVEQVGCQYRVSYFGITPNVEITECNQYDPE